MSLPDDLLDPPPLDGDEPEDESEWARTEACGRCHAEVPAYDLAGGHCPACCEAADQTIDDAEAERHREPVDTSEHEEAA